MRIIHIPKGTFTVALFLTKSILNLRDSSTSKSKRQVNAFSNICPTLHHAKRRGIGVGHTKIIKKYKSSR